jgi:hypothetical protein
MPRVAMKQSWFLILILLFSAMTLIGCEVVGDIFQAGVWVGVILVIGIIALIVWLVAKPKG